MSTDTTLVTAPGNDVSASIPAPAPMSERALDLHPNVALRPEPFGALAYHYDTRRLVFLKHPDVVHVVRELGHHPTVGDTLTACGIAVSRRPTFERALAGLIDSEMLHDRAR